MIERKRAKRTICLLLAGLMLALAGCGGPENVKEPVQPGVQSGGEPGDPVKTLSAAVMPERPRYPETDDGFEYDEDDYEAWSADRRERQLKGEELAALLPAWESLLPALLKEGTDGAENDVCSPANVYMALSMLAETAGGGSRQELLDILGGEDPADQRALTGRLWNALYNDDGTYKSVLGSSVWLRDADTAEYDAGVLDTLARDYYASSYAGEMGSDRYNGRLRDWLNQGTGGMLEDSVGGVGFRPDTVMALASTAYFSDAWAGKFDPDSTETLVFHAPGGDVERDFMRQTMTEAAYYWGDTFAAVELWFRRGGSMRLVLPDEGTSLEEVLADPLAAAFLTRDSVWEGFENNSKTMKIHLALPKFDVSADGDIIDNLKTLGITEVFDPETANFTPLLGEDNTFLPAGEAEPWRVWVDAILHGARVKVDEEGCEAAAYTLILATGAGASMPPDQEEIELTFDRPFLFSLMSGGVPLFAGVVNEP